VRNQLLKWFVLGMATAGTLTLQVGTSIAQSESVGKVLETEATPESGEAQDAERGYVQAADYSKQYSGRAVLVMHRGQIVFERYDGWRAGMPHMLASGTKSFAGVLAMFAVQEGVLSLDEKVCDTIDAWRDDTKKSQITVRHLLTLSSGLEPADAAFPTRGDGIGVLGGRMLGGLIADRAERIRRKDTEQGLAKLATGNWFQDALRVPMKHSAGETFEYGPSHFYVFGELMNRKLDQHRELGAKSYEAYAETRIFGPLGITPGRWGRDAKGNVNIPGGLALTARDWAKFGQFILQRGEWQQADGRMESLLKPELLSQCFEPSATNPLYGLTWWLSGVADEADTGGRVEAGGTETIQERLRNRMFRQEADVGLMSDGKPLTVYMAAGLGKQRLYVLPHQELVVVRFAEATREGARFQNDAFLKPIVESVARPR
jgi:CubicO group peptidase (beta-lactamase class C family)